MLTVEVDLKHGWLPAYRNMIIHAERELKNYMKTCFVPMASLV